MPAKPQNRADELIEALGLRKPIEVEYDAIHDEYTGTVTHEGQCYRISFEHYKTVAVTEDAPDDVIAVSFKWYNANKEVWTEDLQGKLLKTLYACSTGSGQLP